MRRSYDCFLYFCGLMLHDIKQQFFEMVKKNRINPFEANIIEAYEGYRKNLLAGMKVSFSGVLQ